MSDNINVQLWNESDRKTNDLLRKLMRETQYPWVYRKLNRARLHLIAQSRTAKVWDMKAEPDEQIITNGDVYVMLDAGGRT